MENAVGGEPSAAANGIQILLVEDTPSHAHFVQKMLAGGPLAYELTHVVQLRDALAHLGRHHVDVVLLDLTLPDSDGMTTVDGIRNASPRLPIVVLTSLENMGEEAVVHGVQDFLVKGKASAADLVKAITFAINRQRLHNQDLEHLAMTDSLTGALNRRGLDQVLTSEGRRARRSGSSMIVVLVDLDDFKSVNDSVGHAVGDMVLKEVAGRMRAGLRGNDHLARIGGDEFAALLPDTRLMEGLAVAERLRMSLSSFELTVGPRHLKMTASMGVAKLTSESSFVIDELLSMTDAALRRSKRRGKNRVTYAESVGESAPEDTHVFNRTVETLRRGEGLRAVRQPILRLEDGKVVAYEMLSRGPAGGFEAPYDFFRIAYESNILTAVDRRCLQVCVAAAASLDPAARCHVNLLPSTIIGVPIEELKEILAGDGKRRFCVEISEQQTLGDPGYLVAPLKELRKIGIVVAIDDVGFGGSCLENLVVLEPEVVKIDGRWVRGIRGDLAKLRCLERLLRVVESLRAEAIAEGIETEDDLATLKSMGIRYGQGYLLGRPA